jgi:hypothetical protein
MQTDRFRRPTDPALAIFIMRTEDGTHTGILFRMNGVLLIQDVMWHELFRSAQCPPKVPHFVMLALEPEQEHRVRMMCQLIHDRQNSRDSSSEYKIPYAFRLGNDRFNAKTAEFKLEDGLGLSCSTFVLIVFDSVYVPLVNFEGWPKREDDKKRHEALLDKMRNGIPKYSIPPAKPEHVERVAAEVDCIRVRPEEVAATGLYNDLPARFAQLEPGGTWILSQIPPAA